MSATLEPGCAPLFAAMFTTNVLIDPTVVFTMAESADVIVFVDDWVIGFGAVALNTAVLPTVTLTGMVVETTPVLEVYSVTVCAPSENFAP